jgi:hypothetical protein
MMMILFPILVTVVIAKPGSLLLTSEHRTWVGGKLFLYDMATGATDTLNKTENVYGPCFSPDGRKVAFTIEGKTSRIKIMDLFTRKIDSIGESNSNSTLTWANDGHIYHKNGWSKNVYKTNVETGVVSVVYTLKMNYSPVSTDTQNAGIFTGYSSMDGTKGCYTVASDQIGNRAVSIDYVTNEEITINDGGDKRLSCQGAISSDGKYVACANYNHTLGFVKLHNNNGAAYKTISCPSFWMSLFSNDSPTEMIFRNGSDSGTYYYNVETMENFRICKGAVAWAYHAAGWVLDTVSPNPPTSLLANLTDKTVSLSWTASNNATRYLVYRDGVRIGMTNSTSFVDYNVVENTSYIYSVSAATNGVGVSAPLTATFRTYIDNFPPAIAAAFCFGTNIEILFSEPVDSVTATNKLNYKLDASVTVQTASRPTPQRVHLTAASAITSLSDSMVRVSGVKDLSPNQNVIVSSSAPITIVTNVWTSTARAPRWACIDSGALIWYDDGYPQACFASKTSPYQNFPYFQTSYKDGTADSTVDYMRFNISRKTDVLIIGSIPLWAKNPAEWTNTETKIDASPVYRKTFEAGAVALKGSGYGNYKMYVVGFGDPLSRPVTTEQVSMATLTVPIALRLFPSPFKASTRIEYSINKNSEVFLAIYDSKGRIVKRLVEQNQSASNYSIHWNGRNHMEQPVPNGIYFAQLRIDGKQSSTHKIVVSK